MIGLRVKRSHALFASVEEPRNFEGKRKEPLNLLVRVGMEESSFAGSYQEIEASEVGV